MRSTREIPSGGYSFFFTSAAISAGRRAYVALSSRT